VSVGAAGAEVWLKAETDIANAMANRAGIFILGFPGRYARTGVTEMMRSNIRAMAIPLSRAPVGQPTDAREQKLQSDSGKVQRIRE
jgi:hypothetical protein